MCYQRITLPLRYKIDALHRAELPVTHIAEQCGVHRTTIGRELARVAPYDADAAHQHALEERRRRHPARIDQAVWTEVEHNLKRGHSPEQIRGRSVLEGHPCPSIERIYQGLT